MIHPVLRSGRLLAAAFALLLSLGLHAQTPQQEATIRKNLSERLPGIPKIDELTRTPLAGIFEVRMGQDIIYTDGEGSFIFQGQMIDTRTRKNLTEERLDKLTAIAFDSLPLDDAFTIVRGNGKRKLAVFEDPNCGYCKRFERDMLKVNDVTVYLFLMPILGADSTEKSRQIWCAKDRAKAWNDMMVNDKAVARPMGACDSAALTRNVEFGRKYRITGTPTMIFANGKRVPGAVAAADVDKLLAEAR
jgi:thiol:disulfide interchange protein DsbC